MVVWFPFYSFDPVPQFLEYVYFNHNVHPILFSFIRLAGIALIVTFILPYVSPSKKLVSKYEVKKVHSYFNQITQNIPQIWLLSLIPSYKLRIVASIFTFQWIKITWTIHNKDMCAYVPNQNVPNSEKRSACSACSFF